MNEKVRIAVESLIEAMEEISDGERLEVIDKIKSNFCDGCGQKQDAVARTYGGMRCQCQNDD